VTYGNAALPGAAAENKGARTLEQTDRLTTLRVISEAEKKEAWPYNKWSRFARCA